jgi:hypothetical protein
LKTNNKKKDADFNARFDIIAISKRSNNRVALIELKYGRQAFAGKSGIYKHIESFYKYQEKGYFNAKEIIDIINSQNNLGVSIPDELLDLGYKWENEENIIYNFYVITLDNNGETPKHSTPKQTMAAYLFKNKRWNCNELSNGPKIEEKYGDVTKKNNKLQVTFLFSNQTLDNLDINDIIDGNYDDKEIPR